MRMPLAVAGALLLSTVGAVAQENLPHVSVFGTATTQVQPDMLRWQISIKNTGAEVEPVAFEHANTVASTLRFLKDQKIPSDKIQTSQMSISEHREYRDHSWIKEGYDASTDITFTSTDLSAYRALWHGLSKIKGISVSGAYWDTSKRIELQNSTRIEALNAAKTKAEAMAATLGMKLAEPLAIEEPMNFQQGDLRSNTTQAVSAGSSDDGEAVAPGTIDIRIRVRVSFRIVGK